ncbi:hypothetical protein ACU8OQ_12245 [Rhizobium leguminosarum]
MRRIRDFRNRRLAHSLFDKHPDALPHYSDLNALLEVAKVAARHAKFAVEGGNIDLEESARFDRANAEGYANCLLDGLKRGAKPIRERFLPMDRRLIVRKTIGSPDDKKIARSTNVPRRLGQP